MVVRRFQTITKYKSHPVQRAAVRATLEDISAKVAAMPMPFVREMYPVLATAREEIIRDMNRWLVTVPDGNERYTMHMYRATLTQIQGALNKMKHLDPAMVGALTKGNERSAHLAVENTFDELARLAGTFGGSLKPIPLDMTRILERGEAFLIPRFETSARRYSQGVQADIKRQLAVGVVRGESVHQMTNRLQKLAGAKASELHGTDPAVVSENIGDALFDRYRYQAERVVRTELISAYNYNLTETLRQSRRVVPGLKQRWDAAQDARVCEDCRDMDGEVTEIGASFSGGNDIPLHPNCRCRAGGWIESWQEILEE